MEEHPVDIPAEQIVQWLLDDERGRPRRFRIDASREFLTADLSQSLQPSLDEEDREDLTEVTAVGVLRVASVVANEEWALRVRVEDELGQRLPNDQSAVGEPEPVDIVEFQRNFIQPGRGVMFVNAECGSKKAHDVVEALLNEIRSNRHA